MSQKMINLLGLVWLITVTIMFFTNSSEEDLINSVIDTLGNKVVKIETVKEVIPYKLQSKAYKGKIISLHLYNNSTADFSIETNTTDLPELVKCLQQKFNTLPKKGDIVSIYFTENNSCTLLGQ